MNTKKRTVIITIAALLLLAVFIFLYRQEESGRNHGNEPISASSFKLNTVINIKIYDSKDESLLTDAMALCDKYEAIFSRTLSSGEIYRLNHGTLPKENDAYLLSPEAAELISKGLEYGKISDGAFDIAIAPVSSLWDFTSKEKQIPAHEELEKALPLVNFADVSLDGNRLTFAKEGMGLDLGAIAKGYIADKIKEFLISRGVKSAIISLGGNILCIGDRPDGTPFKIGIQKPFADRNETIATVDISDKSVVSSGIYERFFEKDGEFYHHILNPQTGYPYDNSLVSVTIISDKSVDGDSLSTTCFALGLEEGQKLINSLPDVHAVFITKDDKLHYSDGFSEALSITPVE